MRKIAPNTTAMQGNHHSGIVGICGPYSSACTDLLLNQFTSRLPRLKSQLFKCLVERRKADPINKYPTDSTLTCRCITALEPMEVIDIDDERDRPAGFDLDEIG